MRSFLVIVVALLSSIAYGQIKQIGMGEKVGNIEMSDVLYHPKGKINLSEFKGKLVILDFWGTNCGDCIIAMPKMDSLQKRFGDKIQIIAPVSMRKINSVTRKMIDSFWHVNQNTKNSKLPVVLDTVLYKYFPHRGIPFEVWIDEQGTVIGMTDASYVNEKEITNILAGNRPDWEINYTYPNEGKVNAYLNELRVRDSLNSHIRYSGSVSRPVRGINARNYAGLLIDSFPGSKTYRYINSGILYSLHYLFYLKTGEYYGKQTIVETRDSAKYFNISNDYTVEWANKKGFCYNLKVPETMDKQSAYDIIEQDLERALGFTATVDKRSFDCYVIKKLKVDRKIKIKKIDKLSGRSVSELHSMLDNDSIIKYPFLIEGDCQETIVQLPADGHRWLHDMQELQQYLNASGLEIVKEKRMLNALLVSDKI